MTGFLVRGFLKCGLEAYSTATFTVAVSVTLRVTMIVAVAVFATDNV